MKTYYTVDKGKDIFNLYELSEEEVLDIHSALDLKKHKLTYLLISPVPGSFWNIDAMKEQLNRVEILSEQVGKVLHQYWKEKANGNG